MADNNKTIQEQNDRFRGGDEDIPGQIVVTAGLSAHLAEQGSDLVAVYGLVSQYGDFTEENDPWGQHDFGRFEFGGETCYWKIDYYTHDLSAGAEDPSDLSVCQRVLTIMLARDY